MHAQRTDYEKLFAIWMKVFSKTPGVQRKKDIDLFWAQNKHDVALIGAKILELETKFSNHTASIKHFFTTATYRRPVAVNTTIEPPQNQNNDEAMVHIDEVPGSSTSETSTTMNQSNEGRRRTAQEEAEKMIKETNQKIVSLTTIKDTGLATTSQKDALRKLTKISHQQQQRLKRLQNAAERQQKFRKKTKSRLEEMKAQLPTSSETIPGTRDKPGRPRLEEGQAGLLDAIINIVTPNSAADIGRRSELVRSCLTLDDLHNHLQTQGYELSRTATYLRLLPKNMTTIEGRRHHKALPVKLIRARNDGRSAHRDSHFSAASVKFLKDLAELMGSHVTLVISQDDKARVPLGIPAATKEAPILMHMDYRVQLPDHDFPLGSRHKLIPSVYAGITFDVTGRHLTYSGPSYVAIRSGKHDKSSAESHAVDFRKIFQLDLFHTLSHTSDGAPKPIVIVFTDGGPDENPRFQAVINEAIGHFKEFNLDGLFVATHAPGQSALNQVERRMAPLSHDLSGLVLPHDYYGSHLEGTRTVDRDLEVRNFQRAGETLAEVWSKTVINGHEVYAEYKIPSTVTRESSKVSEQWLATHVRTSQYLLQIIKCDDVDCCGTRRTVLHEILQGFLPGPVPFTHTEKGLEVTSVSSETSFFGSLSNRLAFKAMERHICDFSPIPFDWCCPSVRNEVDERVCNVCHIYFASKKAVGTHKKALHTSTLESILETIESVVQQCYDNESEDIPVINDMLQWLQSPFALCTTDEQY